MSPIEWLDHLADSGFRVSGESIEAAFCEASRALFSLMFDMDSIQGISEYRVNVHAPTLEDLLVEWLSDLLAQKDLSRLIFSRFELTIEGNETEGFSATGCALGEPLDRARHKPGTEVKGISYLGLAVTCQNERVNVQVIVDV